MEEFATLGFRPPPTPLRPLLGLTMLVVEDSRFACDALRLMCLRSGARLRRADSLAAARRHLSVYQPCVTLVDMGLPDGSGAELISELAQSSPRIPAILATSADDFAEPIAVTAGADGFLPKPYDSLAAFQSAVLSHLPSNHQPGGPRPLPDEEVSADKVSFRDDLAQAADLLHRTPNSQTREYTANFIAGIARQARDETLEVTALRLVDPDAGTRELEALTCLIDERITETPVM